jgi:hypothetical protein
MIYTLYMIYTLNLIYTIFTNIFIYLGANLIYILTLILEKHGILDRIMAITINNALNNKTLVLALQQTYPEASIT